MVLKSVKLVLVVLSVSIIVALGIVDRAVLLLFEDKKNLFTEKQIGTLESLRFSNEIIAELDYKVCREDRPIDDVTKEWLAQNWNK